ncbi:hypothetical protein [Aquibacillus salsiterrae]|uniref:Uncharacterized protein n=1 Tax=Aquibacillus salsiterrae TaxID=2950439 RepID=A0A9X3WI98_9BACI|nr:hypothetical protein [Aquibacillus salsiterrae]MDC3417959.1 hypothetical protein [Aquibacillus salsiterrae]
MDSIELKCCIESCEESLTYLKKAMSYLENEYSKQKLEQAARDIEECIEACEQYLD